MSEDLLYELRDGIGVITFNRPEVRNALTFGMYEGLADICERAADKGDAKALVLRGAGDKAFAAGTDIAQFRSFRTAEDALGYERRSEEHTSELQSLMRISYAVFCLKKKKQK